jgi:hypothetical protein
MYYCAMLYNTFETLTFQRMGSMQGLHNMLGYNKIVKIPSCY